MKTFFYLQHPLMAMCDPRMKNLVKKEKLKGLGAYWFIMEKIALLPESYFELEYLRPFCKCAKISFAYIKKIILEYQLFSIDEDDFFMPEKLNPPRKKEQEREQKVVQKTTKNTQKNAISEAKNIENQQKTSKIQANPHKNNSHKSLINGNLAENDLNNKGYIKDITTTAATEEKEGTAAAAAVFVSAKIPAAPLPESPTAPLPESPTAPSPELPAAPSPELPTAPSPESPTVNGENPPLAARITLILHHEPDRWQGTTATTASFPEKPPKCQAALRAISPQYPTASPFGTRINTLERQDESPPKRDAGCLFPSVWNDAGQRPKPRSSTSEMT